MKKIKKILFKDFNTDVSWVKPSTAISELRLTPIEIDDLGAAVYDEFEIDFDITAETTLGAISNEIKKCESASVVNRRSKRGKKEEEKEEDKEDA